MKSIEITAKKEVPKGSGVVKSATIYKDFGETAAESIQAFGDEVVNSNFIANAKVVAQAAVRRGLEAGKSPEEIVVMMEPWRPGVAIERVADPLSAALAKYGTMSKEDQDEFIKQLRSRAK